MFSYQFRLYSKMSVLLYNIILLKSMTAAEKYKSSSTANILFILQNVFIANVSAGYVKLSCGLIFKPEKYTYKVSLN